MNKFPKIVNKKWKRYNKLEKVFILYLIVLFILEYFLPIFNLKALTFTFINTTFFVSSIISVFILVFLIVWNLSYRFKNIIKTIFGFEQNEAILNFWWLFVHAVLLIHIKEYIYILWNTLSTDKYYLNHWFYVLWWFLIFWLIWNLFLSLNFSILWNRRKWNYTKVVSNIPFDNENEEKKEVKTLF